MKFFFSFFLSLAALTAAPLALPHLADESKIAFQNTILCKVNDTTISMLDVKKRMDVQFHQRYPDLIDSSQARFQFYEVSWRPIFMEMIDEELILSDAKDKEVTVTDGEVREEVETRFGPKVTHTLEKIGLTYDEALKIIKNDLIAKKMTGWFIHMKGMQKVTPQDIRTAYRAYLREHPPYQELTYQVISLRGESLEQKALAVFETLQIEKAPPSTIEESLKKLDPSVQISPPYTAKNHELSEAHQAVLAKLEPGSYSPPVFQESRKDKGQVARIFYLASSLEHPAPTFDEVSSLLRNELTQKAIAEEADNYLSKLRLEYGYDAKEIEASFSEDFKPFALK